MSLSEFDRHKVDHLFLLVGENPLPNYVAAQLLLKGQKIAYLVFSTHTDKVAGRLKEALGKLHIQVKDVPLRKSESDGCSIALSLQDITSKISPKETIGLHYTGGTKVMAAHAYRAFLNLKRTPEPVFSYLDSRTLQLCIDDLENQQTRVFPAVLDNPPHLETILGLHNLKWKTGKKPQKQPTAAEAAIDFAKFHTKADDGWAWRDWCKNELHKLKQSEGENSPWKDEKDLEKQSILNLDSLPETIFKSLNNHFLKPSSTELDLKLIQEKYGFSSLEAVCQWLDGIWLEEYVLSQVQDLALKFSLQEPAMSLHIEDPNNPHRETDQFEFDVTFLQGYQLFGISCTTSAIKNRCKQKLFEAILRARQLGGDEARIALVSCLGSDQKRKYANAQPQWVKQDANLAISDRKIQVFGRDDLEPAKFSRKLANWIQQRTI